MVQPLPTVASFEECGTASVTVGGSEGSRAAPQSCPCKPREPAPLAASDQRGCPRAGSQVAVPDHDVWYKLKRRQCWANLSQGTWACTTVNVF